jgi:hypothetical protein
MISLHRSKPVYGISIGFLQEVNAGIIISFPDENPTLN